MIGGIRITVSDAAATPTSERLFPHSRHRSARIHKKLVRRHGGVYRMKPAMFRVGDTIVCHPALYDELKRQIAAQPRAQGYDERNPW